MAPDSAPNPNSGRLMLAAVALAAVIGFGPPDFGSEETVPSGDQLPAEQSRVGGQAELELDPVAIGAGDGTVWVLGRGGALAALDPTTLVRQGDSLALGRSAVGPIAVVLGRAWIAGTDGVLRGVDPNGGMTKTSLGGGKPTGIAAGEGRLWVSSSKGSVFAVNPETGEAGPSTDLGTRLGGIAVSAGSVWVASADDGSLYRLDPATAGLAAVIPATEHLLYDVAAGEGGVWVTGRDQLRGGNVILRRLSLEGDPEETTRIDVKEGVRLVAGEGGVWVTLQPSPQQGLPAAGPSEQEAGLALIDPVSLAQIGSFDVGRSPLALAIGAGAVWAASGRDGEISRVDP